MNARNYVAESLAHAPRGEYYLYTDMSVALGGLSSASAARLVVEGAAAAHSQDACDDAAKSALADMIAQGAFQDNYLDILANVASCGSDEIVLCEGARASVVVDAPQGDGLLYVRRVVLTVPDGVSADVSVELRSASALLLQAKVNVGVGARLNLVFVQDGEADRRILTRTTVDLARDAHADMTLVNFNPWMARNEVRCGIHAEGADMRVAGVYEVAEGCRVDNATTVEHHVGHSTSNQLFKGIAHEGGVMAFGGLILVKPDAQKTNAMQTNRHMLMSDGARAYAKPQLEIYADDVKCSHGATVGQIDPTQLFYMRQRGVDEATARQILSAAFVGEVVEQIPLPDIRERVRARLMRDSGLE